MSADTSGSSATTAGELASPEEVGASPHVPVHATSPADVEGSPRTSVETTSPDAVDAGPRTAPLTAAVSVSGRCERIARVLDAPEGSADDGRQLVDDVADLTPHELGYLHPFALADRDAMQRRHDRRLDLVVALWRRRDDARYRHDDAVRTLERLVDAARYDPLGPTATVATAVGVLTRCGDPDTPALTGAAVEVLRSVHRVLEDRERAGSGPLQGGAHAHAPHAPPWSEPLDLATLAALPGAEAAWPGVVQRIRDAANSPWDASFRTMLTVQRWQDLLRLRRRPELWLGMPVEPVLAIELGPTEVPGYRVWLRELLEEALAHVREIREGRIAYAPDGAFAEPDALLVARAALQALVWDEPWIGTILSDLLPAVGIAPGARARGVPSSSLAAGLGLAIARAPTPETVSALTQTTEQVRHTATKKRLRRLLAAAERHLELEPARVLRDASDGELAAGDLSALARSLETGYLHGVTWPLEGWLEHVRAEPRRADLVSRLLWRVTSPDGVSVTVRGHPEPAGRDERWHGAYGQPVELRAGSTVALWHPLPSEDAERAAWQGVIWEGRVAQPFPQAYREHYQPAPGEPGRLTDFAGRVVDQAAFLDAARAEGWSYDRLDHRLVRRVGPNWAQVPLSFRSHPEVAEANATGPILLSADREGHEPWHPGDDRMQRIQVSELLRSVDLALAVAELDAGRDPQTPLVRHAAAEAARTWADRTALRRELVSRATVDLPGARLGSTHLHVGPFAIHLRTGRVTRDGDEVTPDPAAVQEAGGGAEAGDGATDHGARADRTPRHGTTGHDDTTDHGASESCIGGWLPYADGLLSRILATAAWCSNASE